MTAYGRQIDALAARIRELDPRSNVNPTLDRVIYDALQLSFADLERLIERLSAERDERWKEIIKKQEIAADEPLEGEVEG